MWLTIAHISARPGPHGYELEIVRVPWPERGWGAGVVTAGTKISVIVQTAAATCGTTPTNAYINFTWNVVNAN